MPNEGPQASEKQREMFVEYLQNKNIVKSVSELQYGVFRIVKNNGQELTVKLVDIYIVSEADVSRLRSEVDGLGAIVTSSQWNSYTPSARALARAEGVGVFKWKEFMAAIHKDGVEFLAFQN